MAAPRKRKDDPAPILCAFCKEPMPAGEVAGPLTMPGLQEVWTAYRWTCSHCGWKNQKSL